LRLVFALLALVLVAPSSALAHVTILPDTSRPGQSGEFRFRMQNERTDATTVKLEVFVPDGVPLEAEPVKGTTITRIAGGVQWSGFSLAPGRTEDYKVKLGPLPDRGQLVFKALQYYSDGQVVRWIQHPSPDAERPAALLDLGGASLARDANRGSDGGGGFPWLLVGVGILLVGFAGVWFVLLRA
jgi:uncharacterized protein YcnI